MAFNKVLLLLLLLLLLRGPLARKVRHVEYALLRLRRGNEIV